MTDNHTSIVIVDDAKFSNKIIERNIRGGGFEDVRVASSALEALKLLEERDASILVADWLMPEMDGLELGRKVRQLDEQNNHYTYIIILTAKDSENALREAFREGVDDFVNKSAMQDELMPRIFAGQRTSDNLNRLLNDNLRLIEANRELEKRVIMDPVTGLGNLNYTLQQLGDTLKHVDTRDGAACLFLIDVPEIGSVRQRYSDDVADQVTVGVARRLRQLVRPMDTVTRLEGNRFAMVLHIQELDHCSSHSFKRMRDGLNMKAFKTTAGFINISSIMVAIAADSSTGIPTPEVMLKAAEGHMKEASSSDSLITVKYG